jgi:hypothetical protein
VLGGGGGGGRYGGGGGGGAGGVREEWDMLREHDVVFLLAIGAIDEIESILRFSSLGCEMYWRARRISRLFHTTRDLEHHRAARRARRISRLFQTTLTWR